MRADELDVSTPYRAEPDLAELVASRIVDRARSSFLVAQLVSLSLAGRAAVVDLSQSREDDFPGDVGAAMEAYLDAIKPDSERKRARDVLTALAFAEGAGLPDEDSEEIWPKLASAIASRRRYEKYHPSDIGAVLDSVASTLVEQSTGDPKTYRLFHEALASALRERRHRNDSPRQVQRRIVDSLLTTTPSPTQDKHKDWTQAPDYVTKHLATHAGAAGCLDGLIEDVAYLVVAEPSRLLRALPTATATGTASAKHAYQHAVHVLSGASPRERAAQLEIMARQAGASALAEEIVERYPDRPWSVPWAHWRPASSHFIAGRHYSAVNAIVIGELDGQPVIVSGGSEGMVRVWDLATGEQRGRTITCHLMAVRALAMGVPGGPPTIISGGDEGTVRVWDLATGEMRGKTMVGHDLAVNAVAVGDLNGHPVVVSGGEDGTVRVWDLATSEQLQSMRIDHDPPVISLVVGKLDGRFVIVSAESGSYDPTGDVDGMVRVWDLATGKQCREPQAVHNGAVSVVAVGELDSHPVIVSGGGDHEVWVWDPNTGIQCREPLTGHDGRIHAVAVGQLNACSLIVSGGHDGTVRVWNAETGQEYVDTLIGHDLSVNAVAVGYLEGRPVIVSGGHDGAVRVWDLTTGQHSNDTFIDHDLSVNIVAIGDLKGQPVVVSAGDDRTIRVWDLTTGKQYGNALTGHTWPVSAVTVGASTARL